MKTLNIKSTGLIEINVNGDCLNTDVEDVMLPDNFKTAVAGIISSNQQAGITEIHYEDNGFKQFCHKNMNGDVETSDMFPAIFDDLANIMIAYNANAAADAEAKALAAQQQANTTV